MDEVTVTYQPGNKNKITITQVWQAKWWKIPWFVLRRRPWRQKCVYYDCQITNVEYRMTPDGFLKQVVDFNGNSGFTATMTRPLHGNSFKTNGQDLQ